MTWGTPVQSFVFLGLFGFRVRADVRDIRQTDDGRRSSLNAPGAGGHNNLGIHTLHGEYSFWLIHFFDWSTPFNLLLYAKSRSP